MIYDMYRMAEAFVASGGRFGSRGGGTLTEEQNRMRWLCETHKPSTPVFILSQVDEITTRMDMRKIDREDSWRLPFIHTSSNSPMITPVIKITRNARGQVTPVKSIRERTVKQFQQAGVDDLSCEYFDLVCRILTATRLILPGGERLSDLKSSFEAAANGIAEITGLRGPTPILAVASDTEGMIWPGDDPRFVSWFLTTPARIDNYSIKKCKDPFGVCPFSGEFGRLHSNALVGAGLNFANGDFRGSCPENEEGRIWVRGGLSARSADLLYIYKNHIAPHFLDEIAGSKALVIPSADFDETRHRQRFAELVRQLSEREHRDVAEDNLLERFEDTSSVMTLSILWASFGQKFELARGFITGILPSRLAELSKVHQDFHRAKSVGFPKDQRYRRSLDLRLQLAAELLRRPGGASVKAENESPRRFAVLRELARCIYHQHPLSHAPFWREVDQTARAYLKVLLEDPDHAGYQLNFEGPDKKKGDKLPPLTLNGWIRHLYLFLCYLSDPKIGVLPQEERMYEPKHEDLRPLFAGAQGLNSESKVYVFLLGVLFGHLVYVQKQAGYNLAAGALSKLRGGRIQKEDLRELYVYIWNKLLEYEQASGIQYGIKERVHRVHNEFCELGKRLEEPLELPDDQVAYYLMLGMGLSYDFTYVPKANGTKNEGGKA